MINNLQAPKACGQSIKSCECGLAGHILSMILFCNREWCPTCGADWSHAHQRKYTRWLDKVMKYSSMGHLVITIPHDIADKYRELDQLRSFRRSVIRALKARGYSHGLCRWHFFGDKNPGTYHPHLHMLVRCGYISPSQLDELKKLFANLMGVDMCDIHYSYTRVPVKMRHLLRYITRATFTDMRWDEELAFNLKGFHNNVTWGRDWGQFDDAWVAPAAETLKHKRLLQLENKICHTCGQYFPLSRRKCPDCDTKLYWECPVCAAGGKFSELHWLKGVDRLSDRWNDEYVVFTVGWLLRIPRPPP